MTQQPLCVQHGQEILVPLNRLKASPLNARKTAHPQSDIEALAASIAAKGVLQPPVVAPEVDRQGVETGAYLVTIGEGRRQALRLLAKRKRIASTEPVRCLLDADNDAFEISLDENITRFALHPADQFEAFRALAETKGWSAEDIAARFGVSAAVVRQRLRLGAVSPVLMAAFRADELNLEQMMAFAVSEDPVRQEQVFATLSYNRSPRQIRKAMTEHEVEASDRRARFVGEAAYVAAGGRIRTDLFGEDGEGWFEDAPLLDRLALDRLEAEAETVRTSEGWLWALALLQYPHDHGCRRVYPRPVEPDPETAARLAGVSEEYDRLVATCEEGGLSDEDEARLDAIEAELAAADRTEYAPEDVARAGLYVLLSQDGTVRIERGFVRPQDEASEPEKEPETDKGPKPLSERLVRDLTAHRSAALADALAHQPEVAFLACLQALVRRAFHDRHGEGCLGLVLTRADLARDAEGLEESVAGTAIQTRHADWAARLPQSEDGLFEALTALSAEDRLALLAHCVGLSVNAVVRPGRPDRIQAEAGVLAEAVALDMTAYWSASPEAYFQHVPKSLILAAVSEALNPAEASKLEVLPKTDMAVAASDKLVPIGWLPELLRGRSA